MAVKKLEMGVLTLHFVPHFPYSKISLPFVYVMKQDDTPRAHFRQPSFKIVFYRLICVIAVNMKEINSSILKVLHGFIESALYEVRKSSVERIVVCNQFRQDFRTVETGVRIAFPRI